MAIKHTAGKLVAKRVRFRDILHFRLLHEDDRSIATISVMAPWEIQESNAQRLADCWNACEDMESPASKIEEMRAALRDCVESLSRLPDAEGAFRVTCIQQAERALKR